MPRLVQLMAAVRRPGWKWDPWDGVLRHDYLDLCVTVRMLVEQQVGDDRQLQAVLDALEERAKKFAE